MAVNSLVHALEEGRSVHYSELVLWVLQVLEHKHSGDNSTFPHTRWNTEELALTLGVAESCNCGGKLVVVDTVVNLLEYPSDPLLFLDILLKFGRRQLDAHLLQL